MITLLFILSLTLVCLSILLMSLTFKNPITFSTNSQPDEKIGYPAGYTNTIRQTVDIGINKNVEVTVIRQKIQNYLPAPHVLLLEYPKQKSA